MFLVVIQSFAHWVRGEAITAADAIEHALTHHSEKVVRVGADAAPAVSHAEPEPQPEQPPAA